MLDLGLDKLFPQPFFDGLLGLDLLAEAFGLGAVAFQGQQQTRRMVVPAAQDDRRTGIEQASKYRVRVGRSDMVHQENADIFTGNL